MNISLLFSIGCSTTSLSAQFAHSNIAYLGGLQNHPRSFWIEAPSTALSVGHQFAFLFLPLGTIELENPQQFFSERLLRHLTLLGYSPYLEKSDPSVKVTIHSLSLSAYDLLLIRRLSCSIEGEISSGGRPHFVSIQRGHFSPYGFQMDLYRIWKECLDSFLSELPLLE